MTRNTTITVSNKIAISLVILFILIIFLFFYFFDKKQCGCKTEDDDSESDSDIDIEDIEAFTEYFNRENAKKSIFDPEPFRHSKYVRYQEGFQEGNIMNFFNDIRRFFDKVRDAFQLLNKLGPRFKKWAGSFKQFGDGISSFFRAFGASVGIAKNDLFGNEVGIIKTALVDCFARKIYYTSTCWPYWSLNNLWYFLVFWVYDLPLWILYFITGMDIKPIFNNIFSKLTDITDGIVFPLSGYHVNKWPDDIFYKCFQCDLEDKVKNINIDFNEKIPNMFRESKRIFKKGGHDFTQLFRPLQDDDNDDYIDAEDQPIVLATTPDPTPQVLATTTRNKHHNNALQKMFSTV
jgi:hypothetical protein